MHTGLCKELALVWLNGPSIFFALDNPHLTIRGSSFLGLMCFSSSLLSSKVNLLLIFYLWIGACLLSCRIMLQSWGMYPLWLVIFQDSCPGYRNHNSRSEVFWFSHLRWLQAFDEHTLAWNKGVSRSVWGGGGGGGERQTDRHRETSAHVELSFSMREVT